MKARLLIASALAAVSVLGTVGVAEAQSRNRVSIAQEGYRNDVAGRQTGYRQRMVINQRGERQYVTVIQDGARNGTTVGQQGRYNEAHVDQYGRDNDAVVGQQGRNNYATSVQTGRRNISGISQMGANNTAVTDQYGSNNAAGVIQVFTFMWLRTTMNYQYMNGGNMTSALSALYAEGAAGKSGMAATLGGIGRFYKGVQFAVVQNPLSRFGDTAANQGILAIADAYFPGAAIGVKTAFASVGGATWRIFIMPVDTYKTTMQVQGAKAVKLLNEKVAKGGVGVLYSGAAASFAANWVGNYPWFATVRARGHARTRASGNPLANSS